MTIGHAGRVSQVSSDKSSSSPLNSKAKTVKIF